jgi:hypothetical protein
MRSRYLGVHGAGAKLPTLADLRLARRASSNAHDPALGWQGPVLRQPNSKVRPSRRPSATR